MVFTMLGPKAMFLDGFRSQPRKKKETTRKLVILGVA